jgi:hypothetical protein
VNGSNGVTVVEELGKHIPVIHHGASTVIVASTVKAMPNDERSINRTVRVFRELVPVVAEQQGGQCFCASL